MGVGELRKKRALDFIDASGSVVILRIMLNRFEGKGVDESVLAQIGVFFFVYIALILLGCFLLSLEGVYDFETNFTAALTCLSNVGPGLNAVGPANNFAFFSPLIKWFLSFLMLAGRLEIYPILALFSISVWKKN